MRNEILERLPTAIRRHIERYKGMAGIRYTDRGILFEDELLVSIPGLESLIHNIIHSPAPIALPKPFPAKTIGPNLYKQANMILSIRDFSACDYHRVILPYLESGFKPKKEVFIFNRLPPFEISRLQKIKASGVKLICDVDDHFNLDPEHYLYENYKTADLSESIRYCVTVADYVTVTNEKLAEEMRPYNRNVIVIPNALPFDKGQFTLSTDTVSSTPFVFAGGASHRQDLNFLKEVNKKSLTLAGYEAQNSEWQKIYKEFKGINLVASEHLDTYMRNYDGHSVSVAPLRDTLFNQCKSNLKALEAGAKGIPLIASKIHPYYNKLDEKVIVYAETASDWKKAFKMLSDRSVAKEHGLALAEHVREHYNLDTVNELRRQLIESL